MTIAAHAKLALDLRVTGVRDDGFHLIDAEMVTLDLADTVVVSPSDGESSLVVDGPYAAGIGTGSDNLVLRALSLAKRNARVQLTKHIPHGGGLGGGSADAAAVLRWAGFHDLTAASRLGADIPFCMVGGRARVSGIGDEGSGDVVRQIRHDGDSGVVWAAEPCIHLCDEGDPIELHCVGLVHFDVQMGGHLLAQHRNDAAVDLDGDDVRAGLGKSGGQRAEARADLDDDISGGDVGKAGDASHGVRVDDEVLSECAPW